MVNYQFGKIYKIIDNTNGNIYVGSTDEKTLARRLSTHKCDYKRFLEGKRRNVTSFQIFANNNYNIVLLELYPCDSKDELHARERFYIESLKCVNIYIPGRTHKEYIEVNKELVKQSQQKYRFNNKEKIREKQNNKTSCLCGGIYSNSHKTRHEKTIKHQNYINNLCTIQS